MIFTWEIVSPGSELDGEPIEIQDTTFAAAEARAETRLRETFCLASDFRRSRTSLRFVGESTVRGAA